MSDYILWPAVLKLLPVETLLLCTAVCKTWRSLITGSSFISGHLAAAHRRRLLARSPRTHDPQALSLLSDPDPSTDLACPFLSKSPHISFRVVGTVHGLAVLSDDLLGYTDKVLVWNPSIRRSIRLPPPGLTFDDLGPFHFALGFGFDRLTSGYKVVRVVYAQGWSEEERHRLPPLVEVCSLGDPSWRPVAAGNVDCVIAELVWTQCFIHGAVHWVATNRDKGLRNSILLFDLGAEVFKIMKLPEPLVGVSPLRLSVSVIGGLLAVLDRGYDLNSIRQAGFKAIVGADDCDGAHCKINVWVKKGYGRGGAWSKIFTVDENWSVLLALRLRRLGGEAMEESGGGESGDHERDCKDLQISAAYDLFRFSTIPFFAFSFPESLVLLDKPNGENACHVSNNEELVESYPEGESGASGSESKKESIRNLLKMLAMHAIMTNAN